MWMICKKEWQQFFASLTGYLVLGVFLGLTGLLFFVFPDTSLLNFGYASLAPFFQLMPWLLLFLIPAITMRSISEEMRTGTYEILQTLPLSLRQIILGKYLGVLFIVLIALVPTIVYAFSMQALSITGGIDLGATIGSYISLFLLAGVFAAIGIYASSVTNNTIAAFGLGGLLSFALFAVFTAIAKLSLFSGGADYYIELMGIQLHAANISRGVLAASDIIYFVAVIGFFLYITQLQLTKAPKKSTKAMAAIALLVSVTVVGAMMSQRLDLTEDKRFTLSSSTVDLLEKIDSTITVEVFLTGELPTDYKKLSIATNDILASFNNHANNQIRVIFRNPGEGLANDTAKAVLYDSLQKMGVVFEEATSDQFIIPSALVYYQKNQPPIAVDLRSSRKIYKQFNVLTEEPQEDVEATRNAAEALLENKFATAIDKLIRKEVPTIAYVVGNGEPTDLTVNDLGESLRNDYRLGIFDLKQAYPDAAIIKTMIIVKPKQNFTEEDLLKLDQYVMNGGNIIWFIDKLHAELDSLKRTEGQYTAFDRGLGLDELLFKYGVRINGDLLQDLNCSKIPLVIGKNPDGSIRMQRVPWPYYPLLSARTPNPISANLDRVLPIFPSSIDTVMAKGIQKTILLASDTNSRILPSPALVSLNSVQSQEDLYSFNKSFVPVAVLLEGKFNSLFSNRLPKVVMDSVQANTGRPYLSKAAKAGKQIVVADGDIVTNEVSNTTGPLPMGLIQMENYRFANKAFFLNSIDYLSSDNSLFQSRNKTVVLRLLNKQKLQEQKTFWQLINVLLPVAIVLLIGYLFQWWRKKRYSI
ncbi:gliding motility-associated ABC transporter substrate-binding protein GldG [Sediminibacterium sp.]|uniref:gliding motility-associated ABC transporter substrate-binding protein GldG n=1 Tax=Sediminibacterium sp. TaxID=1917865 RepID=UPI002732E909|nr:gliding motility-associated ABC transporter substrate-binding protein GldG [Sediminibacterium sp.]MDP3392209.1 gliding motility-associated ABC transporter substrate-binding protein GldG [Sediminibacterium sp.]MDP3566989.1 gliding motility-associated ABC transporter substrate-binding protein GldG [Sediminibacterium sp.]